MSLHYKIDVLPTTGILIPLGCLISVLYMISISFLHIEYIIYTIMDKVLKLTWLVVLRLEDCHIKHQRQHLRVDY